MKNALSYYYGINVNSIIIKKNGCFFFLNNYKYYFVKYEREEHELSLLVNISNYLFLKNVMVYTFIETKDKKYYVLVDNEVFVLLRVNDIESETLSLYDIIDFNNQITDNNITIPINIEPWSKLWTKKIDVLETEIGTISNELELVRSTFDYYVGLGENAISYINETYLDDNTESIINLNHKRVNIDSSQGYLYNPLNFTFDYDVRDISEYIRSSFLNKRINYDEIENFLTQINFSKKSIRLLYGRLIYPSHYFDCLEKVLTEEISEDILKEIVNESEEYELFLYDMYNIFKRMYNIPSIDWIINK